MIWRFQTYERSTGSCETKYRFVSFAHLPGSDELLCVPFFGATAAESEALALKFVTEEFEPKAISIDGRIQ